MERVKLSATKREGFGKGYNNRLRSQGFIPAIFYGEGEENIPIRVKTKDFIKTLTTEAGENVIIDLEILDGNKKERKTAILKEKQIHPIRREVLHADFYSISLKEKLQIKIPIDLIGESPGVKMGGIIEHSIREIKVRCLPTKIPDYIKVDISGLEIGDSIHIIDLEPMEGVEILEDPDQLLLTIIPPKVKEEEKAIPSKEEPEVIMRRREKEKTE